MCRRIALRRTGVSLVETLVVMAIIGVMISLLMPALHRARQIVARTECESNVSQITTALYLYRDAHRREPLPNLGSGPGGWAYELLPYMEAVNTYRQIHPYQPLTAPQNLEVAQYMPGIFSCPSAPRLDSRVSGVPAIHYRAVVKTFDVRLIPGQRFRADRDARILGFQDVPLRDKTPWLLSPEVLESEGRRVATENDGPHLGGAIVGWGAWHRGR